MQTLLGILLLIAGLIFPLALLGWLNARLSRQPALTARQVGALLAFNGIFPLALITTGLRWVIPGLGASDAVRVAAIAMWAGTGAIVAALLWLRQKHGGGEK